MNSDARSDRGDAVMDKGIKIHSNIMRLAYAKGLGISDLCKQAKVSSGIISDLKHGRRDNIGSVTVSKLCSVLGCEPEDILSMTEHKEPMPDRPYIDRFSPFMERVEVAMKETPELRRLIRAAMKATPLQVKSTAVLLESIVDAQANGGIIYSGEED